MPKCQRFQSRHQMHDACGCFSCSAVTAASPSATRDSSAPVPFDLSFDLCSVPLPQPETPRASNATDKGIGLAEASISATVIARKKGKATTTASTSAITTNPFVFKPNFPDVTPGFEDKRKKKSKELIFDFVFDVDVPPGREVQCDLRLEKIHIKFTFTNERPHEVLSCKEIMARAEDLQIILKKKVMDTVYKSNK